MSINPYESNSTSYETDRLRQAPPIDFESLASGRRPTGVTVLAILHFMHGLMIVGLVGFALAFASPASRASLVQGLGFTAFIVGLTVAIGVGLWKGENWGWRCASFYYVAQVAQPVIDLIRGAQTSGLSGLEAAVGLVCFIYIFKDSVLHYFGMFAIRKVATALRIIGICTVLFAILTFMN